jgi:signal transduction histidine kinase
MSELLMEQIEDISVMDESVQIEPEIASNVTVQADPGLIRHLISNLVTNAVKYNHPKGQIRMALYRNGDQVELKIGNTGKGISPEDQDHIFDRFYRGSLDGETLVEGSGLGLSMAREIARLHGGDLSLVRSDGEWTVFLVTI